MGVSRLKISKTESMACLGTRNPVENEGKSWAKVKAGKISQDQIMQSLAEHVQAHERP